MCTGMTCSERVQMAAGGARSSFATSRVRDLAKRAGPRCPEADVRSIGSSEERGPDRPLVTELSACGLAERGRSVVLQGPAGTGRTCLARALAKAARRRRMRACCIRCPDLEEAWREARERTGGERKLARRHAALQALVPDERPLDRPGELFRGFPPGPMEARCGSRPTVLCTRFRQRDRHARPGGGAHADAIMDRIARGTAWVEMGELDMRRRLGSGSG